MANSQDLILLVGMDKPISLLLERILRTGGFAISTFLDSVTALQQTPRLGASLAILGDSAGEAGWTYLADEFSRQAPALPILLFSISDSAQVLKRAMAVGISQVICPPMKTEEILQVVRLTLGRNKSRKDALLLEARRFTSSLQQQVDELETLTRLGRQVTSSLDLDAVLTSIVDAAVQLTRAEEGSLLLIDEATGDLYMRAARNFQEDFVQTFRLPMQDSLAGQVIKNGEAVLLDESTPHKILTSYLVQSLLYVPLSSHGQVFGVLGVDNRLGRLPLTQGHVTLLNALASYAVIALENARHYTDVSTERNKLETILTGIQDGVLVVDQDQRLGLVNQAARSVFGIPADSQLIGKPLRETIAQAELLDLIQLSAKRAATRVEISPNENNIYSVQINPITGVGSVLTLHDITYLKKLDHIKTEFVHTVSHDLRSPLTAILGYVELIERAGPVTDMQRDFIRRIKVSVHNITRLVDDLLELGRVESDFDGRKENLRLDQLVRFAAEGLKKQLSEKDLHLKLDFPADFPTILANPVQMRQMIDHLLENAVHYTPPNGEIFLSGWNEQNQAILQFEDTGIGIPTADLPFIFDKFYRAANASLEMSGTGLGLAIVKSIVESHAGRVWVELTQGKGSTFTVILPCS